MTEFKELPASQRLFRAAASAVLVISTLYCGALTYSYATGDRYTGNDRLILIVALAGATLCCIIMSADAYDFLMRGKRRYKIEDVRKVEILVLIALGLALAMSALVVGLQLFVTLVPAVAIYSLLVVRPTNEEAHAEAKKVIDRMRVEKREQRSGGRRRQQSSTKGKSRQRSGRKR